jgi:hypothetical protein
MIPIMMFNQENRYGNEDFEGSDRDRAEGGK